MGGGDFVFSNARIKAKEKNLLSNSQMNRLIDSQSVEEAFKMLIEFGLGAGATYECADFDRLFSNEEEALADLLKELSTDGSGLEAFLIKNDFHNLKAIFKLNELNMINAKSDLSEESSLAPEGKILISDIKDAFVLNDFRSLSESFQNVVKNLNILKESGKLTPHKIDVEVDKAMFFEIVKVLKKARRAELLKYFVCSIDIANISSFIRSKKLDLPLSFFEDGFIEGGKLDFKFFEPLYEQSFDIVKEKMKYTEYGSLVAQALENQNLTKFEVECDNMLLDIFKKNKNDMFSAAPIAGYYLGKMTELRAIKLVVAALKNGVDSQIMKQRMRELYA